MYRNNQYTFFRKTFLTEWDPDVKDFLRLKNTVYNTTKVCLGFNGYNTQFQNEFDTANADAFIKSLYRNTKVTYFALMDMDTDSFHANNSFAKVMFTARVLFRCLKEELRLKADYGVFVGMTPPSEDSRIAKTEEEFMYVLRPAILTALSHTSYLNYDKTHVNYSALVLDRKLTTCLIVPPTLYEHPQEPSYVPHNNSLVSIAAATCFMALASSPSCGGTPSKSS